MAGRWSSGLQAVERYLLTVLNAGLGRGTDVFGDHTEIDVVAPPARRVRRRSSSTVRTPASSDVPEPPAWPPVR